MSIDKNYLRTMSPLTVNSLLAKMQKASQTKAAEANGNPVAPKVPEITQDTIRNSLPSVQYHASSIPSEADSGLLIEGFEPDPSQEEAIKQLTAKSRGCLTGAAGTGKTTVMRRIVHGLIYDRGIIESPKDVAFVAFTGTAAQNMAKNLPNWLQTRCMTVHSLLEYAPEAFVNDSGNDSMTFVPRRNVLNPLNEKVIFIDETSMLGMPLWENLKDALKTHVITDSEGNEKTIQTHVYAIGDLNQLPPFGGASSFRDMLAHWPTYELTKIHRQKDPKAQGIIDAAHHILRGEMPFMESDGFETDDWSVWGFELDNNALKAANQVVGLLRKLTTMQTPDGKPFYDPHRDRVLTPGNGYDELSPISVIQQAPLNEAAAPYFDVPTPEHPLTVIDYGLGQKKFAQGFRVMATKNEAPDVKDRVTNGMLGRIVEIKRNVAWSGDWGLVGNAERVIAEKKRRFDEAMERASAKRSQRGSDSPKPAIEALREKREALDSLHAEAEKELTLNINKNTEAAMRNVAEQLNAKRDGGRLAGPASHEVTIQFENGSTRVFKSQSQIESLQLAYVTTVAKSQGSQHETIVMIVHNSVKFQLNRELIYTAITRATRRVIILYTPFGMKVALAKQRIKGSTLEEKIQRWLDWTNDRGGSVEG